MSINPFAGLMAGFRGARAEDAPTEDEEARTARRAEEDQKRQEEDARRAEEDQRRDEEDARRAEEDGGEPDDKAKGKGGRADGDKEQDPEADAADDDADAEEGMDDKEAKAFRRGLAIGRARENTRSSRIFLGASNAGARPDLAATLAFTTRNSSAEASRILGTAGPAQAPRGRSLADRMGSRQDPRPGADGGKGGQGGSATGSKLADAMISVGRTLGQMG